MTIFINIRPTAYFYFHGAIRDIHYRVLQTIQMKLRLLCVWAEPAILGSAII